MAESKSVTVGVGDQHAKLINVLGGLQCLRVAVTHDQPTELGAAVELLEDEVQRIITGLDLAASEGACPRLAGGEVTGDTRDLQKLIDDLYGCLQALRCAAATLDSAHCDGFNFKDDEGRELAGCAVSVLQRGLKDLGGIEEDLSTACTRLQP